MVRFISEAIGEQQRMAAPQVECAISKLSGIRRSSDAVGQRLMTEEERYVETSTPQIERRTATALPTSQAGNNAMSSLSTTQVRNNTASHACPLSGDELRFTQLLLYGGDLQSFLLENHLMASVLAETVNEQLYDEFDDTVIEFDGNTPVLVEDYLDDLKGMIPS
ncbi:MAG: hypothetical protein LUD73_06480 [Lachnospiraceae bacterium]|nr:hypothetical protein [Lachnospiraceae bacterium]